jgi:hypothetical protein
MGTGQLSFFGVSDPFNVWINTSTSSCEKFKICTELKKKGGAFKQLPVKSFNIKCHEYLIIGSAVVKHGRTDKVTHRQLWASQ